MISAGAPAGTAGVGTEPTYQWDNVNDIMLLTSTSPQTTMTSIHLGYKAVQGRMPRSKTIFHTAAKHNFPHFLP